MLTRTQASVSGPGCLPNPLLSPFSPTAAFLLVTGTAIPWACSPHHQKAASGADIQHSGEDTVLDVRVPGIKSWLEFCCQGPRGEQWGYLRGWSPHAFLGETLTEFLPSFGLDRPRLLWVFGE